VIYRSEITSKN